MRWSGWPWLQEQLVRHGAEPEEVEEVEEAFRRGEGPEERHRGPGLPAHPALRRIRARIGNRALAELVREASSRVEEAAPEEASAERAPEPTAAPPEEASPELRPEPRAAPEKQRSTEPAPDPVRRFEGRLDAVLRSLAGGFRASAWLALLEAWPEAPSPLRDRAVRALRTAILRLPAEARKKLARALEELGPVPGVDLLSRLRSALAVAPSGGEAPPPPPPPDDGG